MPLHALVFARSNCSYPGRHRRNAGGHSSWAAGIPFGGGYPTKQEWCHLTVAYLIREKPVPNRASSVPTTTVPGVSLGVEVEGRGYRHRWREKRTQGESTQRTAVPTRVGGGKRRSPITHIRRRLAACAWKHGEAGLTRQRRVWVGRHMSSMCVTTGWGSHRHEECGVLKLNTLPQTGCRSKGECPDKGDFCERISK